MATPLRRVAVSLVLGGGLLAVSWWFRLFYCWGASYDRNPIAARLEMLLCNLWLVASCVLIYCLIAAILFVARSIGRHAESGMAEKDIQVQPPRLLSATGQYSYAPYCIGSAGGGTRFMLSKL